MSIVAVIVVGLQVQKNWALSKEWTHEKQNLLLFDAIQKFRET